MKSCFIQIAGLIFKIHWQHTLPLEKVVPPDWLLAKPPRSKNGHLKVLPLRCGLAHNQPRAIRIAGSRRYQGWWHISKKAGAVCLATAHPTEALYGFFRQLLLRLLPQTGGLLLHASAATDKNSAYLFAGPSGSGKSTICRLAPLPYHILADDITIARRIKQQWRAWGWPQYMGGGGRPIRAVFRLIKHKRCKIEKTHSARGLAAMFTAPKPATCHPTSFKKLLACHAAFAVETPVFDFYFTPRPAAWQRLKRFISTHLNCRNFTIDIQNSKRYKLRKAQRPLR